MDRTRCEIERTPRLRYRSFAYSGAPSSWFKPAPGLDMGTCLLEWQSYEQKLGVRTDREKRKIWRPQNRGRITVTSDLPLLLGDKTRM